MRISRLFIYPVKSLHAIAVTEAIVEKAGFENDRRMVLVDETGDFLSQREFPQMARIKSEIDSQKVIFTLPGGTPLEIPRNPETGARRKVEVWNDTCDAREFSQEASEWFSAALGVKCSLVQMPSDIKRLVSQAFNSGGDIVSFADSFPVLITNEVSLEDLNRHIWEPVPMNRFRPNIVVTGAEPWEEDKWFRISISDTVFRAGRPSTRCSMTTIDQESGEISSGEPLKTLAEFRRSGDVFPKSFEQLRISKNGVVFGSYFIPENTGGVIRLGDEIRVLEHRC